MPESTQESRQPLGYWLMIGGSLLFSVAAAVTLMPNPGASKPNVLGYRSVCSFAPAATALCGLLAGITCTLRNRLVSSRAASARYQPPILAVAIGLLLLTAAAVSGIRFAAVQSRFGTVIAGTAVKGGALPVLTDGVRRATATEGDVSATVEIRVTAGRIAGIELKEGRNVEPSVAQAIFDAVKAKGSTDVDTVSGATATSKVLLQAIEKAAQ
jgi:uncharacterized protein with FMN-binding domain